MKKKDKKRVDLDIRPYPCPMFTNYDYTDAEPNATSPGGGLYHGRMDKYKSVKEFIDKRRKQNQKKRKQAMAGRMNFLLKLAGQERILVLDDDPTRHEGFDRMFSGQAEVTHAYGYDDAIKILESNPAFDVMYFDHDLGDFGEDPMGYSHDDSQVLWTKNTGGKERTGADVALYITRVLPEEKWPKRAVIHSWNPSGSVNIAVTLGNAGIPFVREPYGAPEGETETEQTIWVKDSSQDSWRLLGEFNRKEVGEQIERLKLEPVEFIVLPFGRDPNG